ncbi:hypothetical protein M3Y99_00905000 [Aphelenchoides fujianensis]|nr:hypothetical protein M3Y99_00905000 [Aphelenchoides fujianensis]
MRTHLLAVSAALAFRFVETLAEEEFDVTPNPNKKLGGGPRKEPKDSDTNTDPDKNAAANQKDFKFEGDQPVETGTLMLGAGTAEGVPAAGTGSKTNLTSVQSPQPGGGPPPM